MNRLRKMFGPNQLFPFQLVYKDTKSQQSELPDHLHDAYELVYVHKGKGTFFINHTFYDMQRNDIFAIPCNTIHHALPNQEDPVTSTVVFFGRAIIQNLSFGDPFTLMRIFEQSSAQQNYKFRLQENDGIVLEQCLDRMRMELNQQKGGYKQALAIILQWTLLILARHSIPDFDEENIRFTFGPPWMKETLLFIDSNYANGISLKSIAREISVTPAHLSRTFKQLTGMNFTVYLTTKKLMKAKELIASTNDKINHISEQCGFESTTHFYRVFKKYFGLTPANYRKDLLQGRQTQSS